VNGKKTSLAGEKKRPKGNRGSGVGGAELGLQAKKRRVK